MSVDHLLYLHGFRSSPQSTKARFVAERVARDHPQVVWHCPQLPPSPRQAIEGILRDIAHWPAASTAAVGSSLGGFYATVVAERIGCQAVLLNPAIFPARDLAAHVGEQKAWHSDDAFDFRAEYVDELRALMPPSPLSRPERTFAIIATGDEVLSWREMQARYAGSPMRVIEGSDHAISDFAEHWPAVEAFLFAS